MWSHMYSNIVQLKKYLEQNKYENKKKKNYIIRSKLIDIAGEMLLKVLAVFVIILPSIFIYNIILLFLVI